MISIAATSSLWILPSTATAATAAAAATDSSLEQVSLGYGQWQTATRRRPSAATARTESETPGSSTHIQHPTRIITVPAYFVTYATRFLLHYDVAATAWWDHEIQVTSLLSPPQQRAHLQQAFGSLAKSIQVALQEFLTQQQQQQQIQVQVQVQQQTNDQTSTSSSLAYTRLLQHFLVTYHDDDTKKDNNNNNNNVDKKSDRDEVKRQIGLLFCLLPIADQPNLQTMNQFFTPNTRSTMMGKQQPSSTTTTTTITTATTTITNSIVTHDDLTALLPLEYQVVRAPQEQGCTLDPPLLDVVYETKLSTDNIDTIFGPMSIQPLQRTIPTFSPQIYGLLGISGATGCALTHTLVIPLDVVKTRAQTNPQQSQAQQSRLQQTQAQQPQKVSRLLEGAQQIVQTEGISGLLLGAQATIAGYFWYGLSVYPCYTFLKKWLLQQTILAPPEVVLLYGKEIALLAGAGAAVVASIGLTPLEAARIRVVAQPAHYRPLGLSGTLAVLAAEDGGLYAGFVSLLSRQVIFGSIKFLAFEQTSQAILERAPFLRETTGTALAVSLVAGGVAGVISSVVSQPADSLLTYVAQTQNQTQNLGLLEGCRTMIRNDGVGSLFRGLSSRCWWAGSIIAGQFLLYDVFRNLFRVTNQDLSQVYHINIILP
jgi:solute carrier family 25 (mitochondrial phosphate transporter), member 3